MRTMVVIGDVHGNARALRAALAKARGGPMDELVFLGDLLSYGHDVDEVLELVAEAQARDRATVLVGNHDQMYFDLDAGRSIAEIPDWVRDSIDLTHDQLAGRPLRERLRWTDEALVDGVLVSHANPFGFGDTRYLVADEDDGPARRSLVARGARAGIFGHTHRPRWGGCGPAAEPPLGESVDWDLRSPLLANAGAVGQPRDRRKRSMILRVGFELERATARFEVLDYDVEEHVASLRRLPLPERTIDALCSFFRQEVT